MHEDFQRNGYAVIPGVFSESETNRIIAVVDQASALHADSLTELFAIRRVLELIPDLEHHLFTSSLRELIQVFAPPRSFVTKSIYFDKPAHSNWFVAWHQDISISVKERIDAQGYSQWTQKSGIIGVVPPLPILQNIFTLRIHLDQTDSTNGALRVVKGSHLHGIVRKESWCWDEQREIVCPVPAGGVMLMRPLTLHASRRAQSGGRRRVIHLEFSNRELDYPLEWGERRTF